MDLPSLVIQARRELGLPELASSASQNPSMIEPTSSTLSAVAVDGAGATGLGGDSIAHTLQQLGSKSRPATQVLVDAANGAAPLGRAANGPAASALLSAVFTEGIRYGERSMARAPRTTGNHVDLLVRNAEYIPRLEADLAKAQRSITINQFSWELDGAGARVADLLERKARAGLDVRVLMDGYGIKERGKIVAAEFQSRLERAGVRFVRTGGFQLGGSGFEHRKLITVDDQVTYTGGLGFGAKYDSWTDLMVRIEGPAAATAAATALAAHRSHRSEDDPRLKARLMGIHRTLQDAALGAQALSTGPPRITGALADATAAVTLLDNRPGTDLAATEAFLRDAAAATTRLWATSTYLTTSVAQRALIEASRRGVDVKVMFTGPEAGNDAKQIALSRSLYGEMIDAGVEVFEYPTILHAKSWLKDADVAAVGSMNLSRSSMARARELTARIEDPTFASQYASFHEQTRAGARLVQRSDVDGLGSRALGLLRRVGLEF